MGNVLELAITNLTSPVVLFFALGIFISLIKAKVELPSAISDFITLYLLIAIGVKGGAAVAEAGMSITMILTILGSILLGIIIPFYSFYVLRHLGKFKSYDAAAMAGHYGSISVVTFMAATSFLANMQVGYEGYINGIPALMEVPAIIIALMLAAWYKENTQNDTNGNGNGNGIGSVVKQVMLSKSVVLLLGGMVVGYIAGPIGVKTVAFFYKDLFMGLLSLFMLEMGIIAAKKLGELKGAGMFLILFGIITPPINAVLGIIIGLSVGLSVGGATLLGVLSASSSYIVAPAAMRVSLPKANPAMYLGSSLGITLPFNLIVGIPIYYSIANYFSLLVK